MPVQNGVDPAHEVLQRFTESTEVGQKGNRRCAPRARAPKKSLETLLTETVDRVISETESCEVEEWQWTFLLARALKSIPGIDGVEPLKLEPWVIRWWNAGMSSKAAFDEEFSLFLDLWDTVRFKEGEGVDGFLRRAMERPLPPELTRFGWEVQTLGRLCRELHAFYAPEPFYLSTRMAAKLVLGTEFQNGDQVRAMRWFRLLERFNLLEVTEKGKQGGKRASRFMWKGSLPNG